MVSRQVRKSFFEESRPGELGDAPDGSNPQRRDETGPRGGDPFVTD
jgi:hypothetical protein